MLFRKELSRESELCGDSFTTAATRQQEVASTHATVERIVLGLHFRRSIFIQFSDCLLDNAWMSRPGATMQDPAEGVPAQLVGCIHFNSLLFFTFRRVWRS